MQGTVSATAATATAIFFFSCCCFSVPAGAQSSQTLPPDGPTLKGAYVLTDAVMCTPGKGGFSEVTGLATFDPKSGKLKLEGYSAGGDPVTLSHVKQTLPYTNSASTVTFGDTVYQATYGTIEKGIATYLSLIVAADPCASQVWLSRK